MNFIAGKRYLIKCPGTLGNLSEIRVVEVSPSGRRVKLELPDGKSVQWVEAEDYELVEELN